MSGGCSDTDMNALAVMPWICSPTRVVMTVTPVANMPSVRRNSAASSCAGTGVSSKIESPIPAGAVGIANSLGSSI